MSAMQTNQPTSAAVRAEVLDQTRGPRWRRPWVLGVAALAVLGALALAWRAGSAGDGAVSYRTAPVARGNLALTVTANGTVQPTRAVNIGSELSGTVARVLVDVNDQVKKGQVLVELDTAKLLDQVQRSRAALDAAEAAVAQALATRREAEASLARLDEVRRLSGGKVPSAAELDGARAALERARGAEASARANVTSARAALSTDTTNLGKASIRAPVDGIVLTRNVDPGNAVAASLQAVTLFTLAEDLHRLRLLVNVDEADVGQVKPGMPARFTVSAWPGREFPATITRVAYGSTLTDNVVTYVSYLDVANPDLSLRPGMTATATIRAEERRNVLLVPNSALRFTPGSAGREGGGGLMGKMMPRMPPSAPRQSGVSAGAQRRVWVLQKGVPQAVDIRTGISDGRQTEVLDGPLAAGAQVIVEQRAGAAPGA